jgi:hypothetical protein
MLYASNHVLHVIFPKMPGETQSKRHTAFLKKEYEDEYTRDVVKEVRDASARYEGPNQFVGFNLPARFVHRSEPILWSKIHRKSTRKSNQKRNEKSNQKSTRKSNQKSTRNSNQKKSKGNAIHYVIAYMDGDTESKEHELRHARYFLDKDHKARVHESWTNLKINNPSLYKKITEKLIDQGYKPDVFEDEFGAYYPHLIKK